MFRSLMASLIIPLLCVALSAAEDAPKLDRLDLSRPENAEIAKKWEAIKTPAKTPFDGDVKKRADYLRSYRDGYFWAQGNHLWCPTNPADHNLHAIRGWVEGWQAGVKAGGETDLPAKFAPYLVWRGDDK
jgi:hypothetical protein